MEFVSGKPREFFIGALVTRPPDVVQELASTSSVDFGVEDFGYFVFEVSVDFDRRRRGYDAIRNFVRGVGLELRDVEDGVNTSEGVGKSEGERVSAGPGDNLVGSEILLRELCGGTGGAEELGFDECVLSNLEVRCRGTPEVSVTLIAFLRVSNDNL